MIQLTVNLYIGTRLKDSLISTQYKNVDKMNQLVVTRILYEDQSVSKDS